MKKLALPKGKMRPSDAEIAKCTAAWKAGLRSEGEKKPKKSRTRRAGPLYRENLKVVKAQDVTISSSQP
jgi:hypothetical protein